MRKKSVDGEVCRQISIMTTEKVVKMKTIYDRKKIKQKDKNANNFDNNILD